MSLSSRATDAAKFSETVRRIEAALRRAQGDSAVESQIKSLPQEPTVRKSIVTACLVAIAAILNVYFASTASSAIVVSMVGTVEEGNLNGVDLAGVEFAFGGIVNNNVNIDNVFPGIGTFVLDEAILDFGDRGFFDFGSQPSYFFWGTNTPLRFYAAVATNVDVATTLYGNAFGFFDTQPDPADFADFDPTRLTNFGPYTEFDNGYTSNADNDFGPFSLENEFGDSIVMNDFANSGALFITTVPEPSAGLGIVAIFATTAFRRRR